MARVLKAVIGANPMVCDDVQAVDTEIV